MGLCLRGAIIQKEEGRRPAQPACLHCPAVLHSPRHHVCGAEGAGPALPVRGHSRWGEAQPWWSREDVGCMREAFPVEVTCELSPEGVGRGRAE